MRHIDALRDIFQIQQPQDGINWDKVVGGIEVAVGVIFVLIGGGSAVALVVPSLPVGEIPVIVALGMMTIGSALISDGLSEFGIDFYLPLQWP